MTWGCDTSDERLFLLPTPINHELARRHDVIGCRTWGDAAELGDDLLEQVLGMAGYGTIDQHLAHLDIVGVAPLPGVELTALAGYDHPFAATLSTARSTAKQRVRNLEIAAGEIDQPGVPATPLNSRPALNGRPVVANG